MIKFQSPIVIYTDYSVGEYVELRIRLQRPWYSLVRPGVCMTEMDVTEWVANNPHTQPMLIGSEEALKAAHGDRKLVVHRIKFVPSPDVKGWYGVINVAGSEPIRWPDAKYWDGGSWGSVCVYAAYRSDVPFASKNDAKYWAEEQVDELDV